jgi:nucleotide-binding universal stress UspA family protein
MNIEKINQSMHILLAVDGSEYSLASINLLCDLPIARALSSEGKITIVAVDDLRHPHHKRILLAILDKAQKIFEQKNIHAQTDVLRGDPAAEITRYASEYYPDLIVVGAKGLRATLGILLGGVAQQVVEYAFGPVLVVRAPYKQLRNVLLVTDGSAHSKKAAEYVTQFPWPEGITIHAMHVLPPLPQPVPAERYWPILAETLPPITQEDEVAMEALRLEQVNAGNELLDTTINNLQAGGLHAIRVLSTGDAATEIIEYIRQNEIDLFVAGSRGLSEVRSWLVGSVSRKLIHYAGCSGLLVK